MNYTASYYESDQSKKVRQFSKSFEKLIIEADSGKNVIDLGCGAGLSLEQVQELNPELNCYGIDIGQIEGRIPDFVNFSNKDITKEFAFKDKKFSFVIIRHVLEHLSDPGQVLEKIIPFLEKGAVFYIEVPYYRMIFTPDTECNFYSDFTHIKPFTRFGLRRLAHTYDLSVVETNVIRNFKSILISPYLFLKYLFLRDTLALGTIFGNILGSSVYLLARYEKV